MTPALATPKSGLDVKTCRMLRFVLVYLHPNLHPVFLPFPMSLQQIGNQYLKVFTTQSSFGSHVSPRTPHPQKQTVSTKKHLCHESLRTWRFALLTESVLKPFCGFIVVATTSSFGNSVTSTSSEPVCRVQFHLPSCLNHRVHSDLFLPVLCLFLLITHMFVKTYYVPPAPRREGKTHRRAPIVSQAERVTMPKQSQ